MTAETLQHARKLDRNIQEFRSSLEALSTLDSIRLRLLGANQNELFNVAIWLDSKTIEKIKEIAYEDINTKLTQAKNELAAL